MRSQKLAAIVLSFTTLLVACSNSPNSSVTSPAPNVPKDAVAKSPTPVATTTSKSTENGKPTQGGQVVEAGAYHLELLLGKEENNIHLDFFLQTGDNHEAIPDAKVSAQVQFPDGTQQSYELTYDAPAKHYTVNLPTSASGEYKIAILSDIKGEKVNGRFNYKL